MGEGFVRASVRAALAGSLRPGLRETLGGLTYLSREQAETIAADIAGFAADLLAPAATAYALRAAREEAPVALVTNLRRNQTPRDWR